ncbi:MAG: DUF4245 family protein [Nocardioides sp.]
MSQAPSPERPGRYQRSAGGLIGALVILLGFIAAFVAFRAVTRSDLEVRPESVDYRGGVADVQAAGLEVVYPRLLPAGWIATRVQLAPVAERSFGISMLTDDGAFAGVRQDDVELDALLATYVDEKPTEGDVVDIESAVGSRWRVFTDEGGDTAYAAQSGLGDSWVLVYGSASPAQLEQVVAALTTDPL